MKKFYKGANKWMWNYCKFLGSYTGKDGGNYDLGVFVHPTRFTVSAAIVYGNKAGEYLSGELDYFGKNNPDTEHDEIYEETRKRAEIKGYYTPRNN